VPGEIKKKFAAEMDDDFNTPKAIAHVFEFVREVNPLIDNKKIGAADAEKILEIFDDFNKVLAIIPRKIEELLPEVRELVQEREEAREKNDFTSADKLRKQIKNLGYEIDDTAYGPLVKKVATCEKTT
jgi:cysteinyl-tRNA synthetase